VAQQAGGAKLVLINIVRENMINNAANMFDEAQNEKS
jgi:hypothetical protein